MMVAQTVVKMVDLWVEMKAGVMAAYSVVLTVEKMV